MKHHNAPQSTNPEELLDRLLRGERSEETTTDVQELEAIAKELRAQKDDITPSPALMNTILSSLDVSPKMAKTPTASRWFTVLRQSFLIPLGALSLLIAVGVSWALLNNSAAPGPLADADGTKEMILADASLSSEETDLDTFTLDLEEDASIELALAEIDLLLQEMSSSEVVTTNKNESANTLRLDPAEFDAEQTAIESDNGFETYFKEEEQFDSFDSNLSTV